MRGVSRGLVEHVAPNGSRGQEVLFRRRYTGKEGNDNHDTSRQNIKKCDVDVFEVLFTNVVMSCVTTMLRKIGEDTSALDRKSRWLLHQSEGFSSVIWRLYLGFSQLVSAVVKVMLRVVFFLQEQQQICLLHYIKQPIKAGTKHVIMTQTRLHRYTFVRGTLSQSTLFYVFFCTFRSVSLQS